MPGIGLEASIGVARFSDNADRFVLAKPLSQQNMGWDRIVLRGRMLMLRIEPL